MARVNPEFGGEEDGNQFGKELEKDSDENASSESSGQLRFIQSFRVETPGEFVRQPKRKIVYFSLTTDDWNEGILLGKNRLRTRVKITRSVDSMFNPGETACVSNKIPLIQPDCKLDFWRKK